MDGSGRVARTFRLAGTSTMLARRGVDGCHTHPKRGRNGGKDDAAARADVCAFRDLHGTTGPALNLYFGHDSPLRWPVENSQELMP